MGTTKATAKQRRGAWGSLRKVPSKVGSKIGNHPTIYAGRLGRAPLPGHCPGKPP